MSRELVARYLSRLRVADRPPRLDVATVTRWAHAHAARVPFENLRLHADDAPGEVILDAGTMLAGVVDRREGGICYELNASFGWLLEQCGAQVDLLGARVEQHAGGAMTLGIPLGHLALRVTLDDAVLHVDVGFGGPAIVTAPVGAGERVGTSPERGYVVDPRSRALSDFADAARWHSTDPGSRFQRSIVCSLAIGERTTTLSGVPADPGLARRLAPAHAGLAWRLTPAHAGLAWRLTDGTVRRDLSPAEAARVLRERFGIARALPTRLAAHGVLPGV
ncbi:arylamine N-acetyltransferase family protein [Microbacterium sp. No. 7]|uniref:arylamine N-acetyltransferase family protein n=1 Tax=Microbacterium sp. No. 7 TaxID=1714373 RepID=UPI0006CFBB7E|nr:arylamine N-acetyltransferase [Microbacterium sp. No. 7]